VFDEVVEDAGEFVGGGGDGFRGAEACFHTAEVIAEGGLAAVEALSSHARA
jgi:hypothetical protein